MSEIAIHSGFNELVNSVYQTHCVLHQNAQKAININLTLRNWLIGCYIVEFEQNGEDRAKYGDRLIEEMSKVLKKRGLKGLNGRALRNCRLFYVYYPQIWRTVTAKLQGIEFNKIKPLLTSEFSIWRTVSAELQMANNQNDTIWRTVSAKSEANQESPIQQTLSVELQTVENQDEAIRRSLTAKLQITNNQSNTIRGAVFPESQEDYPKSL